ncbi:class I SAM-dependent methyltransferase [Alteromonas antoniana]|uniref:class I SAM-dependent methyltransferase n=1 Tax=Alteromonas antoniana TaxID=2803813 RepID=UPI001C46369C|nr:class I SAM-dependent methyltransferase [Alteromonas antoniana]
MILSQQSQLLERNLELFEQGDWLFVNPTDAYFTDNLKHRSISVLHQYFDIFSESVRVVPSFSLDSRDVSANPSGFICEQKVSNHTHWFAPFVTTTDTYTDILLFMPKSKAHFQMLLRMAAGALKAGGRIHVVGENKGGIKSAAKLMTQYGNTQKLDSARHCSLITTSVEESHLAFEPDDWMEELDYEVSGHSWQVVSMPGVFSHGELDNGTRLLIEKLSSTLRGQVLDFACGAGVIGSYLLARYPHLKLTMLDVSALALFCASRTLHANQQAATLIAADGLNNVELNVEHVVTNPPFHTGVKTDYSVTKRFINDATRVLKPQGSLLMVANRFLPYPGLLSEKFAQVQTVAQNTQFSVYLALR